MKIKNFKSLFSFAHDKPLVSQNRVSPPVEIPYRLIGNLLIMALIASVCLIIVTIRDNLIHKKINSFMDQFYQITTQNGWAISDIVIEGRHKTGREELLNKINLTRADNILQADLPVLKQKIEELPWIEKADVKRRYFPNILQIKLYEKDVLALWQSGDYFFPIDKNGKIINAHYTPHHPILVIVGHKAPDKVNQLLKITSSNPELQQRIKAAVLYSGRRWDLIFDDIEEGITVKMPEKDLKYAWDKFVKINNSHGLLKRKLTFIDLRYKNKLTVTVDTEHSAVANIKKNKKDK